MLTKRIFTSIDLPSIIHDQLESLQNRNIYWIKWMKPQNLHITLNFLGDLGPAEIDLAAAVILDTTPFYKKFKLQIDKVKAERDMLWLLPAENPTLLEFQQELQSKLREKKLGKRERYKYSPHILLAKSKKSDRPMTWQPDPFAPIEFTVDKINLYESELTPGAATHTLIETFPLG